MEASFRGLPQTEAENLIGDLLALQFQTVPVSNLLPRAGILGLTFKEDVPDLRNSRIPDIVQELQQFETNHIWVLENLPVAHRDPFDRIIIAQAIALGLPILSVDAVFDAYPVHDGGSVKAI